MKQKAYAQAGVDIDLGNKVKASLPRLLAAATRPEVLGKIGGFGGLFALNTRRYRQPVLVSSTDGVGTKLKVAFAMDRHDTIGQDLVNHCVNDIAVVGAEPLFFLDYLGTGKLEPRAFKQIIGGFATACAQNRCALIGGETAQMPGFYQPGEYDVSGTIVGVVDKPGLVDGRSVRPGDILVGLGSSGLHTNGYSLARTILFDRLKLKVSSRVAELGRTVGEELLRVHVSYGPFIQKVLRKFAKPGTRSAARGTNALKGVAHITGGGFIDNIPRVLPSNCDALVRKASWDVLPIFNLLQRAGEVAEREMYQVFNMGIGMVLIVAKDKADAVLKMAGIERHPAWIIGEVVKGRGVTRLV